MKAVLKVSWADLNQRQQEYMQAIYETDQLGLTLRDSIKIVTQRMGFFVGQNKYLEERAKIQQLLAQPQ